MAPLAKVLFIFLFSVPLWAADLTVKRVVDGDTLVLSNNEKVRLIGVDTPEYHTSPKMKRDAERAKKDMKTIKALGKKSSDFTKALLNGQKIKLEYDQTNAAKNHRDRYGRVLAYVYIDEESRQDLLEKLPPGVTGLESFQDGFLNALIIEAGYGNTYTSAPFKYKNEFLNYERSAREKGRGLWAE